ncbi:ABC transporter ATP-binding protein [Pseudorhodoplanes sp.]|uniref:ABC transporter ATP-binding protein n=1 Tax=Pseudorhodoplanes sp. TaxID=1934341 RepID=UPI003D0C8505
MNVETSGASVAVRNLRKSFGDVTVIADLSVTFQAGKISVLLGSSGCGKTTILRCIAGLETPNGGDIVIHDREVFSARQDINLPPERRGLGMVFQSYAIWPHMTVHENVALPLRAHGVRDAEVRPRVEEVLTLVGLEAFAQRSATQLSGGQQQRVAIARCLVSRPQLILLDEPLSNLDAKLRISMRAELRALQRRFNTTMIFVTHDQEEALSLGDEIFLFRNGQLEQNGQGEELYRRPNRPYVAEFFGKANLFKARFESSGGSTALFPAGSAHWIARGTFPDLPGNGGERLCMVRPEAWRLSTSADGLPGRVEDVTLLGDRLELKVATDIGPQVVLALGYERIKNGDTVVLTVSPEHVHFVPSET